MLLSSNLAGETAVGHLISRHRRAVAGINNLADCDFLAPRVQHFLTALIAIFGDFSKSSYWMDGLSLPAIAETSNQKTSPASLKSPLLNFGCVLKHDLMTGFLWNLLRSSQEREVFDLNQTRITFATYP